VPFTVVAGFAPGMAERGRGAIINVSSMAAQRGLPGGTAYGASKAAEPPSTAAEYSRRVQPPSTAAEYSPRVQLPAESGSTRWPPTHLHPTRGHRAVQHRRSDHAAQPGRQPRRDRRCDRVPGLRPGQLDHRRHRGRRWRAHRDLDPRSIRDIGALTTDTGGQHVWTLAGLAPGLASCVAWHHLPTRPARSLWVARRCR
jgi:hypothetical protein